MRSAWLWLLGRLALAPLVLAAGGDPLVMNPRASLILIALVGTLSWLDTRGQNEDLLLANLGTSRSVIHTLGFGPPLALECLAAVIGWL